MRPWILESWEAQGAIGRNTGIHLALGRSDRGHEYVSGLHLCVRPYPDCNVLETNLDGSALG